LLAGWSGLGLASAATVGVGWSDFGAAGAAGKAVGCKLGDAIDAALGKVVETDASLGVEGVRPCVGTVGSAAAFIAGAAAAGGAGGSDVAGALAWIGCGGSAGFVSAGFASGTRGAMVAVATGVSGFPTEGQLVGGDGATVSCGERCAMTTFATTPTATA
jgi:hypothetical protein